MWCEVFEHKKRDILTLIGRHQLLPEDLSLAERESAEAVTSFYANESEIRHSYGHLVLCAGISLRTDELAIDGFHRVLEVNLATE